MSFAGYDAWFGMVTCGGLAALGALAAYYALRRGGWKRRKRGGRSLFHCTACGRVYFEGRDVPMAKCPRCGRMNENVRQV